MTADGIECRTERAESDVLIAAAHSTIRDRCIERTARSGHFVRYIDLIDATGDLEPANRGRLTRRQDGGFSGLEESQVTRSSLCVLSREYPADADIQRNPSPFTNPSDLPKRFMRVRARPAFSPFRADDASSILVGRSV
jgi:hypothetical protein